MIAYLDNSATTRPIEPVIDAMAECMREGYFNPSSQYAPAVRSEKMLAQCREALLKKVQAREHVCLFTSGGTEANNLAILGSVGAMRGKPPIAVGVTEHPSVLASFAQLEAEGYPVQYIPVTTEGLIDYENFSLHPDTALVSFMQVNNETGALLDLDRFCREVRSMAPKALIHVDGVQGFLRVPLSLKNIDMYTLSAHKIHGPKGVGALLIKKNVKLKARQIGGGQENSLRSGTENTPGIAGLYGAVTHMDISGLEGKKSALLNAIRTLVPEALVNGPLEDSAPHILNMSFPGVRGEVMLHALEEAGVYVSTGSACSSKKRKVSAVLTAMGMDADRAEAALRFSLSPHTTMEEIEYAAKKIGEIYPVLKRFRRK
ncbi:MAG: cysteine desulfurase [Clostridiales bacterium]|nr:cysteine desulfurase [Clostridiales bacterium]